jgi:outer membrane protein OmpA-like peptidoglycan-associated protein
MRNKTRPLAAAAVAAAAVAAAAGCASGPHPAASLSSSVAMPAICAKTGPVVFAESGRQDSPAPALTGTMQAAATQAIDAGAAIGLVDVDGRPRLAAASAFSDPGAGNSTALNQDRTNFLGQIESAVFAIKAANPHVDVLGALDTAGRAVRAACAYGGTVYLKDSGLSETGVMDFRQPGLLEAMPSEVVASLTAEHELPDLKGIAVVLIGIGDTAPPQQPLSIAERDNLVAIWSAIARAGGATSVQVDPAPLSGPAPAGVPPVSLVPVLAVGRVHGSRGTTITVPDLLLFHFNSAALIPAANNVLQPIAGQARSQHLAVSITGYASPEGSAGYNIALSERRAIAVRDRLIALGLPAAQITHVTGAGAAGHSLDSCLVRGHLDETRCAPLRRVVVMLFPSGS